MIRFAAPSDLPQVLEIYDAILTQEESGGPVYTNWRRGKYPTADTARSALEAGTLYVGESGSALWGVVNLNGIQLPEYALIPWTLSANEDQVGVIHTLCIHPGQSGRSYARQTVTFGAEEARRLGKNVMRLDTWEHNLPANRLYPSLGYHFAGAAEFFFQGVIREILNCYEKAL